MRTVLADSDSKRLSELKSEIQGLVSAVTLRTTVDVKGGVEEVRVGVEGVDRKMDKLLSRMGSRRGSFSTGRPFRKQLLLEENSVGGPL